MMVDVCIKYEGANNLTCLANQLPSSLSIPTMLVLLLRLSVMPQQTGLSPPHELSMSTILNSRSPPLSALIRRLHPPEELLSYRSRATDNRIGPRALSLPLSLPR